MAPTVSLFVLLLCMNFLQLVTASPKRLVFPRQDDGGEPLVCRSECDIGSCASDTCGFAPPSKRSWMPPPPLNISWFGEEALEAEAHHVKRFFRLSSGATRPLTRQPSGPGVMAYIYQQWVQDGDYDNQYNGQINRDRGSRDEDYEVADRPVPARKIPQLFYSGRDAPVQPDLTIGDERAMSQQFRFFGADGVTPEAAFQVGQSGMTGCTVVAVISKRAVWMAHFWEKYTNGNPPIDTLDNDESYKTFKERFLDFLDGTPVTNPSAGVFDQPYGQIRTRDHPYLPPSGDSIDADLFNRDNDNTRIFVYTPAADGVNDQSAAQNPQSDASYRYGGRTLRVIETIQRHIKPSDPASVSAVRIPYVARPKEVLDSPGYQGRGIVLFQFDPDADAQNNAESPRWRLIMEGRYFQGEARPNLP